MIPNHGTRRGGLIQVVPRENISSYSYKAPTKPTELLGVKPATRQTTGSKDVKDSFTEIVNKGVVANVNDNYFGNLRDAPNHDVTLSMTSTEASKVLGLEVVPPVISYKKLMSDESNILEVTRLEPGQNIPNDSVIDQTETKSPILVSEMGSRPLPQWSRHLHP